MDYYNEFDKYPAQWLESLRVAGHIPDGKVDGRSILDVKPADLAEYRRLHFFAGIGGWALALKMAGWPEGVPVWTGSCPCQPFSICGKKKGEEDERHLWPAFRDLIGERRPAVVFGEQVASPDGREWLSGVRADLEGLGYRFGGADLCAAGVSAPHIRQRLYWVADSADAYWGSGVSRAQAGTRAFGLGRLGPSGGRPDGGVAYADQDGRSLGGSRNDGDRSHASGSQPDGCGTARGLVDTVEQGLEGHPGDGHGGCEPGRVDQEKDGSAAEARCGGGPWSRFILIPCADGKTRRLEPGIAPLADGVPARVGKLRAYGNAIVPQVAARFIKAYIETLPR